VAARTGAANTDPIKPLIVHTVSYRTVPVQTAALAPMPMMVPVAVAAAPAPTPSAQPSTHPVVVAAADPQTVPASIAAAAPATPAVPAAEIKAEAAPAAPAMPETAKVTAAPTAEDIEAATAEGSRPELAAANVPSTPVHARGGWLIQIGAFDDESDAKQHLNDAQSKAHGALAAKDPFTERIQKGDKALYRARFAGFDKATAEAACRQLKRSDIECMAVKD
jgi:D-alanyl-D-alanine carboxypeptidase